MASIGLGMNISQNDKTDGKIYYCAGSNISIADAFKYCNPNKWRIKIKWLVFIFRPLIVFRPAATTVVDSSSKCSQCPV